MIDEYTLYDIEEKERENEKKRERKGKGSKKNKHFSPTPLHSLIDNMYLSLPDINKITRIRYKNPVISLYLNFTPDMLLGDNKVMLYFDSLKHLERQKRKEYIKSLTHDQQSSLKNDFVQIKEFLEHYFDYQNGKSFIIFKSGQELNLVLKINSHTRNVLTIDPNPLVQPLEEILENNNKVLYVIFERKKAHFYFYHLGYNQFIDSIKSFVPSDIDLRPATIQKERLNHLFIHFRKTAELLSIYDRQLNTDAIILFGEKNLVAELEHYLSEKVRHKIKDRYFLSAHWQKGDILNDIEHTLDKIKKRKDRS